MAEEYNQHLSEQRHYQRMHRLQEIRDNLTEVINYFYDYPPRTEEEERDSIVGMKDRLDRVWYRLDDFMKEL